MSDLYVTCRRCDGWGSIETSQSEDGRFSYQDQCPECSSYGVVPASPADILAAVRTFPGAEERWRCWDNIVLGSRHASDWTLKFERPTYCRPENGHKGCGFVVVVVVPLLEEE